jgi:hypothetical protein
MTTSRDETTQNEHAAGDERRIAQLLRLLPPAPRGWVQAAQELPAARAAIDELVARAGADAAERRRILADLEAQLAAEGVEPAPAALRALRLLLDSE